MGFVGWWRKRCPDGARFEEPSKRSGPVREPIQQKHPRSLRGRPFASTRAWIFVVMPPRLRPTQRSPLFFGTGGMLMNANDRTVDHLYLAVVGLDDGV